MGDRPPPGSVLYVALMNLRRGRPLAALLALLAVGAGIGIGAAVWAGGSAAAQPPHFRVKTDVSKLFALEADAATATRKGDIWRLALRSPRSVLWFADRPVRASGSLSAAVLTGQWPTLFAGGSPYGAVVAPDGALAGSHPTAVQISAPAYDPVTRTLVLTLRPDRGESAADAAWLTRLSPAAGRVVVFVDGSNFTLALTVLGPPNATFTPDTTASSCATPGAVTDTGTTDPGTGAEIYSTTLGVTSSGMCDVESSVGQWDNSDGFTFQVEFSDESLSCPTGPTLNPCDIDEGTGDVVLQ